MLQFHTQSMSLEKFIRVIFDQISGFIEAPFHLLTEELSWEEFYIRMSHQIKKANIDLKNPNSLDILTRLISKTVSDLTEQDFNVHLYTYEFDSIQNHINFICQDSNEQNLLLLEKEIPVHLLIKRSLLKAIHADDRIQYFFPINNDGVDQQQRIGSCGFISIKTTREKVLEQLTLAVQKGHLSVIKKIGDQIRQEILALAPNEKPKLPLIWSLNLEEALLEYNNQERILQAILEALKTATEETTIEILNCKCDNALKKKKQLEQNLDNLLYSPELIQAYLNENIPEEYMAVGMATAWAEVNQLNLNIWRDNGSGGLILFDGLSHFSSTDAQTIDIYHDQAIQHFERLQLVNIENPEEFFPYEVTLLSEAYDQIEKKDLLEKEPPMSGELSKTTQEILARVKEKNPEAYSIFLGEKAFQAAPSTVDLFSEEEHKTKMQLLYNGSPYVAHCNFEVLFTQTKDDFKSQFLQLMKRLELALLALPWNDNQESAGIKKMMQLFEEKIFTKDFGKTQKPAYFETLKYMLEEITLFFVDEKIPDINKSKLLPALKDALLVCAPGVFSKVDVIFRKLKIIDSLFTWLADFREEIILLFAELYTIRKNKNSVQTVHVRSALSKYSRNQNPSWNPAGNDEILTDDFIKMAELTEDDIIEFHKTMMKRYTPHFIIENLVTNMTPLIKEFEDQDDYLTYYELVNSLLEKVGVSANDCIKDSPNGKHKRVFDFNALRMALLKGLVTKKIFTPKVLELFSSYTFNQHFTIHYCDAIPTLSYVVVRDEEEPLFEDCYLLTDYLARNSISQLPAGFCSKAVKDEAKYLLLLVFLHGQQVSEKETILLQIALTKTVTSMQELEELWLLLTFQQRILLITNNFFLPNLVRTLIKDWACVKTLMKWIIDSHQINSLNILFDQVLTEEFIIQLVSNKEDVKTCENAIKDIRILLEDKYFKYWMHFVNITTKLTILESCATIQMIFAMIEKADVVKGHLKSLHVEQLTNLFNLSSAWNFFIVRATPLLLLDTMMHIDNLLPSFWNIERIKVLFSLYVKTEEFRTLYNSSSRLTQYSASYKTLWNQVRQQYIEQQHRNLNQQPRPMQEQPIVVPPPQLQRGPVQPAPVFEPRPINAPHPQQFRFDNPIMNEFIPMGNGQRLAMGPLAQKHLAFRSISSNAELYQFLDTIVVSEIESFLFPLASRNHWEWGIAQPKIYKIFDSKFTYTLQALYIHLLEDYLKNDDYSELKQRVLNKFPEHQKREEQFKLIIDTKSFFAFFGQDNLHPVIFKYYWNRFLKGLQEKDYQEFSFLKPQKGKQYITSKPLFKNLSKKKNAYDKYQLCRIIINLILKENNKYICEWLEEIDKDLLLNILSLKDSLNLVCENYSTPTEFLNFFNFLWKDKDRIFTFLKNFKESPAQSLAGLLKPLITTKRFEVIEKYIFGTLNKEELKELFPDFKALKEIIQLWNAHQTTPPIRIYRKRIIELIIDNQVLDCQQLLKDINEYQSEVGADKFLAKRDFPEIQDILRKKIKSSKETKQTFTPLKNIGLFGQGPNIDSATTKQKNDQKDSGNIKDDADKKRIHEEEDTGKKKSKFDRKRLREEENDHKKKQKPDSSDSESTSDDEDAKQQPSFSAK